MKETRQSEEAASKNARLPITRILLWALAVSVVLALSLVGAFQWRRDSTTSTGDPYARIPFRPRVTYDSSNVIISNTEEEPYLDTSLNLYVGAILYRAQIGTIRPGETIKCSLQSLTNEHGESFKPGTHKTSQLEVRARFGGHNVHKDFPPPP